MALWKEGGDVDFCQVAWQGPGIPERTIVPGCYLSAEPVGTYPQPADGAKIGNKTPVLYWNPREAGVVYDVYFDSPEFVIGERGFLIDAKFETLDEIDARIQDFENWSWMIVDFEKSMQRTQSRVVKQ